MSSAAEDYVSTFEQMYKSFYDHHNIPGVINGMRIESFCMADQHFLALFNQYGPITALQTVYIGK